MDAINIGIWRNHINPGGGHSLGAPNVGVPLELQNGVLCPTGSQGGGVVSDGGGDGNGCGSGTGANRSVSIARRRNRRHRRRRRTAWLFRNTAATFRISLFFSYIYASPLPGNIILLWYSLKTRILYMIYTGSIHIFNITTRIGII